MHCVVCFVATSSCWVTKVRIYKAVKVLMQVAEKLFPYFSCYVFHGLELDACRCVYDFEDSNI